MSTTCILTDSTVQFPTPVFTGRNLVNMISLHVDFQGRRYEQGEGLKAIDLEKSLSHGSAPQIVAPSVEDFTKQFTALGERYTDVLTILHSTDLSDTYENAAKAVKALEGQVSVLLVDSHTTATGLGLVVQTASAAADAGTPAEDIERDLRELLSKVYSVFCIEGLTYLEHGGYLGAAQATVGEHLKMLPIYVLENGKLSATQKARNLRHLVDILYEFLFEFEHLGHVAFLQGVPAFETETRALRERMAEDFPNTAISEHTISATLASIIGPRSLGMFVMQGEENE